MKAGRAFKKWDLLIPVVAYIIYTAVVYGLLHYKPVYIRLAMWHLLPLEPLLHAPVESLLLLHSQPPLLNLLLWLTYFQQQFTRLDPQLFATGMFSCVTLANCVVWYVHAYLFLRSRLLATIILLLLLANPSMVFFNSYFGYTNLEMCSIGLLLLSFHWWLASPGRWRLAICALALALLNYLRALYHPALVLPLMGLVAIYLRARQTRWQSVVSSCVCALLVYGLAVAPWMIKNKLLFNFYGFSSWNGLNLKTNLSNAQVNCPIWHFANHGTFDPGLVRPFYSSQKLNWLATRPVLTNPWKDTAPRSINLNHYAVPALSQASLAKSLSFIRAYPDFYRDRIFRHLIAFDLAGYYRIYSINHQTGTYRLAMNSNYAHLFDQYYYGSVLRHHMQLSLGPFTYHPSLFMLLWFPLALGSTALQGLRIRSRKGFISALMLLLYGWLLVMLLLVDGAESARMRWPQEPLFLVMLANGFVRLYHTVKRPWQAKLAPSHSLQESTTQSWESPTVPGLAENGRQADGPTTP